jgi:Flp pilus assembly protein TadB
MWFLYALVAFILILLKYAIVITYITSGRKRTEIFKGIHNTANQTKKWKKQNIGLHTTKKAMRKKEAGPGEIPAELSKGGGT